MAGYVVYSLDWDKFQRFVEQPTPGQLAALAGLLRDGIEEHDGEFDDDDPVLAWSNDDHSLTQIVATRFAIPDWYGDLSEAGKSVWEGAFFNACRNFDGIDVGFRADSDGVSWDVITLALKHLGAAPGQGSDVALASFGKRPFRYQRRSTTGEARGRQEQDEAERRSSLTALGGMLGQFLKSAKPGRADPNGLLEELQKNQALTEQHRQALKGLLGDEDSDDDGADSDDWEPMHSMHAPEEVQKMVAELRSLESVMQKARKKELLREYEEELRPAIEKVAGEGRMLFIQVDS